MYLVIVNWIRIIYPLGLNKAFGSKVCGSSWVWQKPSEEGWRRHQPKHCEYNNKDEDNSSNTLNDIINMDINIDKHISKISVYIIDDHLEFI